MAASSALNLCLREFGLLTKQPLFTKHIVNYQIVLISQRWFIDGGNQKRGGRKKGSWKGKDFAKVHVKTRAEMIDVEQTEWSNVYETASPYNKYVVPLELRMGRENQMQRTGQLGRVPLSVEGNIELLKISNFFHLTPPAIKKHCEALVEFCTPWPKKFKQKDYPLRITSINHLYSGPSIRHPDSKKVKLQVYLQDLHLKKSERNKLILLVGDRYNPNNDELTIIADKCPTRKQNREYANYLLTALCVESMKVQPWESESSLQTSIEIKVEMEKIRAEMNPAQFNEKSVNRRYHRVINERLVRYNSYGHPFVMEMRKYGIKGGLNAEEMTMAKAEWKKIQKGLPDSTSFDLPYKPNFSSEFNYF